MKLEAVENIDTLTRKICTIKYSHSPRLRTRARTDNDCRMYRTLHQAPFHHLPSPFPPPKHPNLLELGAVVLDGLNAKELIGNVDQRASAELEPLGSRLGADQEQNSLADAAEELEVALDAQDLGRGDGSRDDDLGDGGDALGNLHDAAGVELVTLKEGEGGDFLAASGDRSAVVVVVVGGIVVAETVLDEPVVGGFVALEEDLVGDGGDLSKGQLESELEVLREGLFVTGGEVVVVLGGTEVEGAGDGESREEGGGDDLELHVEGWGDVGGMGSGGSEVDWKV